MLAPPNIEVLQYIVANAAGNVVLLIDAGCERFHADKNYVREVLASLQSASRIDIVGFVSRIDGVTVVSFWNPDGTPEKMCGNACRSVPLALKIWLGADRVPDSSFVLTEFCRARVSINSDGTTSVEFPMDAIATSSFLQTRDPLVDVGTPHVVRAVKELFSEQVNIDGERLSTSSEPVNVTFCKVAPTEIIARTFERGVGETKSCGTGAIAAAIALEKLGKIDHLSGPRRIRFVSGCILEVAYGVDRASIGVSGKCELVAAGVLTLR